jgi:hypothetical protein
MHIGGVAKKIGLTPDPIRFYERTALLSRARWNDKPPSAFCDGRQSTSSPPSKTLSITSTESKHKQPNAVILAGALKTLPRC